jgi:hypothetical protein
MKSHQRVVSVKRVLQVLIGVVLVYMLICAGFLGAMMQTPDIFGGIMRHVPWPAFVLLPFKPMWTFARRGHVNVGDPAPDFSLETTDHNSRVQLSALRGQMPVVLVFGSYT